MGVPLSFLSYVSRDLGSGGTSISWLCFCHLNIVLVSSLSSSTKVMKGLDGSSPWF